MKIEDEKEDARKDEFVPINNLQFPHCNGFIIIYCYSQADSNKFTFLEHGNLQFLVVQEKF